jgi:hypothetical protein
MVPGADENPSAAPLLWPNPASDFIKGILNARLTGKIRVEIFTSAGKAIRSFETTYSRNSPFEMNVGTLAGGLYFIRFTNSEKGITSTGKFHIIR